MAAVFSTVIMLDLLNYAVSRQYSPSPVFFGQKKPRRPSFIGELWTGQLGAVFFVGSICAGVEDSGGSAPIAFSLSTSARRSPALPSPSSVTAKPSIRQLIEK